MTTKQLLVHIRPSSVSLQFHYQWFFVSLNEKFEKKDEITIPAVKHGGGCIMVWIVFPAPLMEQWLFNHTRKLNHKGDWVMPPHALISRSNGDVTELSQLSPPDEPAVSQFPNVCILADFLSFHTQTFTITAPCGRRTDTKVPPQKVFALNPTISFLLV